MSHKTEKALRVAIIAPTLDILGGQGVQARSLVDSLMADGIEVSTIAVNPRFPKGLGWARRIPVLRTLLNQCLYFPSLKRLRQVDVVHIFSASYWSFLLAPVPALLAAKLFSKPAILNYHSGEANDHLANWGWLVHPGLRMADSIVVPSIYLQSVFYRHGYYARVIRNIIDISSFSYRERSSVRPRLLSNRNLERHYGVDKVLHAFSITKTQYPEATLTIAGYGSQRSSLEQWVASEGLSGVTFVGRVEPDHMPTLYNDADIFVNASTVDNQPISILEAFAAGLPVISTPTGDIPNMLGNGTHGMLTDEPHPESIAKATAMLIEKPQAAQEKAISARQEVKEYTWDNVRGEWLDCYKLVVKDEKSCVRREVKCIDETKTPL